MTQIIKMLFGSHLYGTNTPSSDMDYKGVYLPTKKQIILGTFKKSISENTKQGSDTKNTKDDIDTEMYSLHYFIDLACAGETVALDMLHAPMEFWTLSTDEDGKPCTYHPIWMEIIDQRNMFYTKNLKAFVEYARRQASKYGVKGSRLNDAFRVLEFLGEAGVEGAMADTSYRLRDVWDQLPVGEHIRKIPATPESNDLRMYEVCNRQMQETVTLGYAIKMVGNFYEAYGSRAKMAAENKGVDWKAVSHAFRAAYEVKQLLTEGTITFPLREAEFLKQIKTGQLDYMSVVAPALNDLITEVEEISAKSLLPETVDRQYWQDFLVYAIETYVLKEK